MPSTGLSEASLGLLRAAVVNEQTVQRYGAKTRPMLGSSCLWWTGAVSARGYGRIWLGESDGRDVVVIAHRFAWEWASRRHAYGNRLRDRRGSRGRARTIRDLRRQPAQSCRGQSLCLQHR